MIVLLLVSFVSAKILQSYIDLKDDTYGWISNNGTVEMTTLLLNSTFEPEFSSQYCEQGTFSYNDTYVFLCVHNNTIKRIELDGW